FLPAPFLAVAPPPAVAGPCTHAGVLGMYATSSGCCVTLHRPLRDGVVTERGHRDSDTPPRRALVLALAAQRCGVGRSVARDEGLPSFFALGRGSECTGHSGLGATGLHPRLAP